MIVVAAHPKRADMALALAERVGAAVVWDQGFGPHDTMARSWRLAASKGAWATVLEDDAVPLPDLAQHLDEMLANAPARAAVFGLYLGTNYPPDWQDLVRAALSEADRQGAAFIEGPAMLHGVGITMPKALALSFAQAMPRYSLTATDRAVGRHALLNGHRIFYPSWSLVDHADLPSLVSHPDGEPRTLPRKAHRHGAPEWNSRSVTL